MHCFFAWYIYTFSTSASQILVYFDDYAQSYWVWENKVLLYFCWQTIPNLKQTLIFCVVSTEISVTLVLKVLILTIQVFAIKHIWRKQNRCSVSKTGHIIISKTGHTCTIHNNNNKQINQLSSLFFISMRFSYGSDLIQIQCNRWNNLSTIAME